MIDTPRNTACPVCKTREVRMTDAYLEDEGEVSWKLRTTLECEDGHIFYTIMDRTTGGVSSGITRLMPDGS